MIGVVKASGWNIIHSHVLWPYLCHDTLNWLLFVMFQFSSFSSVPSMTNLRTDEYRYHRVHENDSSFVKESIIINDL